MTDAERFWRHVEQSGGCWLWTGAMEHTGYGQITRRNRHQQAHRYAWVLTHGPIPDGLRVCHTCDVKRCVNPSHLFLGTQRDNMQDAKRKGLLRPGFKKGNRYHKTLTPSDVAEIRATATKDKRGFWNRGVLARKYGVDGSTILRVLSRRSWND